MANKKKSIRRFLPLLGGVLLVALVIGGLWPRAVPVEVAKVQRGALRATVNEEGKTRIKHRYLVSAPVTGALRRIPYKAGEEMVQGKTLVAQIDPVSPALLDPRTRKQAQARSDAALAALAKARANLDFAQSELKRNRNLFAEKTISAQELESFQLREVSAAREVEVAEGAWRQADAELAQFDSFDSAMTSNANPVEIRAPVSGKVLRIFEESSRVVTLGTPLVEIGNPADLEVIIECLSRDGAIIQPGNRVEFEQWGGGVPLIGRVRLVEPAAFTKISALGVEEQRVNVVADLVTPPEDRPTVGDQFRVEARVVIWEEAQVLKVPSGALFRRANDWAVFTVANGRAEARSIKVGQSSSTETQILDGLKENDSVILYPGSRVKPGQRVRIIDLKD